MSICTRIRACLRCVHAFARVYVYDFCPQIIDRVSMLETIKFYFWVGVIARGVYSDMAELSGSAFGEKTTSEHSALAGLPAAPPAYDEPPATVRTQPPNFQPPLAQPQAQMGQYPQYLQYPQQVQVGGVPPQTWSPQGYPVSCYDL